MATPLRSGARIRVRVPASTANLGPGFDAIGCALKLHNVFEWWVAPRGEAPSYAIGGPEAAGIPANVENVAVRSAQRFLRDCGVAEAELARLSMRAKIAIPPARGLGSSSTAIVGGVAGANALLRKPRPTAEALDAAVAIEGHPDNVAPALLGGLVVCATETKPLRFLRLRPSPRLAFIVIVPDYHVATADARAALPKAVPMKDAVFNLSRMPLLIEALRRGDSDSLRTCIADRLHQDYRKPLYRHYDKLEAAAYKSGAAAFAVSGAGPTMLAIAETAKAERCAAGIAAAAKRLGLNATVRVLPVDARGTAVSTLE